MSFLTGATRTRIHLSRIALMAMCVGVSVVAIHAVAAKERKGQPQPPAAAPSAGPVLPADLNDASLRVSAIDVLYQFDFTSEQLKALQTAAAGTANAQARPPALANAKLAEVLNELERELLAGKDDAQITKTRNLLIEMMDADGGHLDDEVHPTDAARAKVPAIFRQIKASQIAAYLTSHGHEVADPEEVLMGAIDDLRDFQADKTAHPADEVNGLIDETASDVGYLVAGLDDAKAKTVTAQANAWLKSVYDMSDADFAAGRAALPVSARKIVGEVDAMQVISNWLQRQLATLISNPQLPQAIDLMLASRSGK